MITAEEARKLSKNKYHGISNEIEKIAKNGGYSYHYKDTNPISHELYVYLIELGYRVLLHEETVCDEDHYGKDIPGTERTIYHIIIDWKS